MQILTPKFYTTKAVCRANKKMYILELTTLGDSAASLIKDGKLIAIVEDTQAKYGLEANTSKIIEAFRFAVDG